jgi:thiol-disulfide isomerase/thioredoxin
VTETALASEPAVATVTIQALAVTATRPPATEIAAPSEVPAATATPRVVAFVPVQGRPSLIQFYEEGCGPCVTMQDTVAALQAEYAGRVAFGSAEITDPDAAAMVRFYRARGTPFIVLLGKDGEVAHRIAGVVKLEELRQWLDRLLK